MVVCCHVGANHCRGVREFTPFQPHRADAWTYHRAKSDYRPSPRPGGRSIYPACSGARAGEARAEGGDVATGQKKTDGANFRPEAPGPPATATGAQPPPGREPAAGAMDPADGHGPGPAPPAAPEAPDFAHPLGIEEVCPSPQALTRWPDRPLCLLCQRVMMAVASNERHDIVLIGLHEAVKLSLFPG